MEVRVNRRSALKAGAALAAAYALPAGAQAKPTIRFAAVFSDKDIRADMIRMLAKDVEADFKIEPFFNALAVQAGHRAGRPAARQPRDGQHRAAGHLQADSGVVDPHFGVPVPRRQSPEHLLGERPRRAVQEAGRGPDEDQDPRADLLRHAAGGPQAEEEDQHARRHGRHQARMPPGDAWQLLGRSLGANPTPMAFAETYTGLQTGAVDGQDNPLPNVNAVKFYEVMSQIVLTSHLIGYDLLCDEPEGWNSMSPAQQKAFQAAVDKALELEHGGAPEARGGAGGNLQEAAASRSTPRTSRPSARTRRRSTSPPTRRRSGRRACSRRSRHQVVAAPPAALGGTAARNW